MHKQICHEKRPPFFGILIVVMISVIIPVYNAESTLDRLFASLDKQSYKDFETVFVNDGSTDDSESKLKEYCRSRSNSRYITTENGGQSKARNLGIKMSNGEFICFIDSDDYVLEDYLKHMIEKMDIDVDMVTAFIRREFSYKPNILERNFQYSKPITPKTGTVSEYPEMILEIINAPYAKLIRKSILTENDIRFPEGITKEDLAFTHTIISKGTRIVETDYADYMYIMRKGSTMTSSKKVYDIFDAIDYVVKGYRYYPSCKETVDYYMFHHICIGGIYQTVRLNPKETISFIRYARKYLKDNDVDLKNNKLLKSSNIIFKMLALIFG